MKICLSCGCQIVKMHRTDDDCLKALKVQIPSLQSKLLELQAAQHRIQTEKRKTKEIEIVRQSAERAKVDDDFDY